MIEIFEGIIDRGNFKISPFIKDIEKLFASIREYQHKSNDLTQNFVNFFMHSIYGVQIRKDNSELYKCKSQNWIETEYKGKALDYWRLPNGNYVVIFEKPGGLDADNDEKNALPSHLGAFFLSNSERIMNNIIREINGFHMNSINYGDADSLYFEEKFWDVLVKASLVVDNLCQGTFCYGSGGIFHGLSLAPEIKLCLIIFEIVILKNIKLSKDLMIQKDL